MTHPTPSQARRPQTHPRSPSQTPTETPTCLCTSGAVICSLFAGCQLNRLDFQSQIFIFGNKRRELVAILSHCNYSRNKSKRLNNLENLPAVEADFHIVSAIVSDGLRGCGQNAAPEMRTMTLESRFFVGLPPQNP